MTSGIKLIDATVSFFDWLKFLADVSTIWCCLFCSKHYGSTNVGIPDVLKTIQPIAAIMKPIPAINLILIFWYPLWYVVYQMMAYCTFQATVFLMPI